MGKYAIIGFGTAGYHALKALRSRDPDGQIDVYTNTRLPPYNPMLTTYYAAGRISYEALFPFGSLEQIRQRYPFCLRHAQVESIEAETRSVLTGQSRESYDKLLIATGARAFAPPVAGLADQDRFLMRTVEDAQRLRERIQQGTVRSAVVVGASMVGIKVVELLNQAGIKTVLVDLAQCIFPLSTYPDVAQEIQRRVESKGVGLRFGTTIQEMRSGPNGQEAVLSSGEVLPADIVALCIGTRANTQVAQGQVEIAKGIVVDRHMAASVPGIYAAGDCCEGLDLEHDRTQIIGLWANANHQGLTAGANMAGEPLLFDGNILHNITHFMDMDFIGLGDNRLQGDTLEYGSLSNGLFVRLIFDDDRIVGANILDNFKISGIIKNYMLRLFRAPGEAIPDFQKGMLVKAGLPEWFVKEVEGRMHG